jgi:hypothetical protein
MVATLRRHLFGVVSGLLLVGALYGGQRLLAQTEQVGNGLRISPIRHELTLSPGQSDSYTIEVTNITTGPTTVTSVVNDFESDDETGQPKLLTQPRADNPFSLRNFVDLPGPFNLDPDESKTVTISVRVADTTAPGAYWGAIRFNAGTGGAADENATVALSASVAGLLLVSVPGDVTEQMSLEYIKPRINGETRTIFETAPDEMSVRLKNEGNSLLKPFGQIRIKNMFGSEVYSYELNNTALRGNVLPRSGRTFVDGIENIGLIGRYTVEATLSYGAGGGNIISAKTSFWVVPWKLIILALVVIAAIIWFATRGLKTYNRRVVERAKKNSR